MEILSTDFFEGNLFSYLILPLLIFFARISDVTIGTMRIVMVSKGQKLIAPLLGFFEVIIWLVTMSKIIQNIDNWVAYVAYGAGFATGNYIGLIIEEKLAVGIVQLQIITRKSAQNLIAKLKAGGYGRCEIHQPANIQLFQTEPALEKRQIISLYSTPYKIQGISHKYWLTSSNS